MSEREKNDKFNEILERYEKEIFNYCFQRLSHNKFLAEEVFDDVFMTLFNKWDQLTIGDSIRAYLYRTADVLVKERLRKESRYYRFNSSLEETEEEPILLLDDITGELDILRREYLFSKIKNSQVFITCTDTDRIEEESGTKYFKVEDGTVYE